MTSNQRTAIMADWWPAACRVQGWNSNDRDLRLRVLSLALNCKFAHVLEVHEALENYDLLRTMPLPGSRLKFRHLESASALNNTSDVDAVKSLLEMLANQLTGAAEQGRPQDGHGRRFSTVIDDLLKCLALYPLADPMGANRAYDYALKVACSRVPALYQLSDLDDNPGHRHDQRTGLTKISPSDRQQILYTLTARLNGKTGFRAKAGHTLHQMHQLAGMPCAESCRACRATITPPAPVEPALPVLEALPAAVAPEPAQQLHEQPF